MSETVVITIERWKHKRLMETLEAFRSGIRLLKLNDVYKKVLMEDICRIEGILKSGEKVKNV